MYIQNQNGLWNIQAELVQRREHLGNGTDSYLLKRTKTGRYTTRREQHLHKFELDKTIDKFQRTGNNSTNNVTFIPRDHTAFSKCEVSPGSHLSIWKRIACRPQHLTSPPTQLEWGSGQMKTVYCNKIMEVIEIDTSTGVESSTLCHCHHYNSFSYLFYS